MCHLWPGMKSKPEEHLHPAVRSACKSVESSVFPFVIRHFTLTRTPLNAPRTVPRSPSSTSAHYKRKRVDRGNGDVAGVIRVFRRDRHGPTPVKLRLRQLHRRGNLHAMKATIQDLFSAAMTLDADSRRDLSEQLWDTVQPQDESVFSEATWQEIGRRVVASDEGKVEHVAGDIALAQVRAEHGLASS